MYELVLSVLLGIVCYFYGWYRTKRSLNKKNTMLFKSNLRAIDANVYEIARKFNVDLRRGDL